MSDFSGVVFEVSTIGNGEMAAFYNFGGNADDSTVSGDIFDDNGTGADDGSFADSDVLDDGGTDTDEGGLFDIDMAGHSDSGADVNGFSDVGFVVDDAAGVADGGVFDVDMGANLCSSGNYDIFANGGGVGDGGGGMDGTNQADAGFFDGFSVGLSDSVIANSDNGPSKAEFVCQVQSGQITEYFNTVNKVFVQCRVGIEKTDDIELVIITEDVEDHPAVTAGTDYDNFHRNCLTKLLVTQTPRKTRG